MCDCNCIGIDLLKLSYEIEQLNYKIKIDYENYITTSTSRDELERKYQNIDFTDINLQIEIDKRDLDDTKQICDKKIEKLNNDISIIKNNLIKYSNILCKVDSEYNNLAFQIKQKLTSNNE